jgi:hypothetical protein
MLAHSEREVAHSNSARFSFSGIPRSSSALQNALFIIFPIHAGTEEIDKISAEGASTGM